MSNTINNLSLEPYKFRFGFVRGVQELVEQNAGELGTDFPNVHKRYDKMIKAAASVRRAIRNPDIDAFAVVAEAGSRPISPTNATFRERIVGLPDAGFTLWVPKEKEMVGVATLFAEDEDPDAAYAAWWVDKDHQGQGIGEFTAEALVAIAAAKGVKRLNAYVRPENEASTKIVTSLGFEALGKAAVVDLGDDVTAERQKYTRFLCNEPKFTRLA